MAPHEHPDWKLTPVAMSWNGWILGTHLNITLPAPIAKAPIREEIIFTLTISVVGAIKPSGLTFAPIKPPSMHATNQ